MGFRGIRQLNRKASVQAEAMMQKTICSLLVCPMTERITLGTGTIQQGID